MVRAGALWELRRVLAVYILVILGILVGIHPSFGQGMRTGPCTQAVEQESKQYSARGEPYRPPSSSKEITTTGKLEVFPQGSKWEHAFRQDRHAFLEISRLKSSAPLLVKSDELAVHLATSLRRSVPGGSLDETNFAGKAVVANDGMSVAVVACLDPGDAPPGRYLGNILVTGRGIDAEPIPVEVTLQAPVTWPYLFWILLGTLLGFGLKTLTDIEKLTDPEGSSHAPTTTFIGLLAWYVRTYRSRLIISFFILMALAVVLYWRQVLSVETFGDEAHLQWQLAVTAMLGQVAISSGADLVAFLGRLSGPAPSP